jgi:NAD+ kinase
VTNSPISRLGLVVHETRPEAAQLASRITTLAGDRGLAVHRVDAERPAEDIDLLIGIGGDGTLLNAANLAMAGDLPVVGVNLGSVGYLADVEPDMVETMLDGVVAGSLEEQLRMTLRAELADGRAWGGINDVVVEKVVSRRLVQITVEINGQYFTTYRADGLIVATPLGSTAYSLSAGGPVLDPALDALILTPVAPHSLLSRSIVLAPDALVRMTVELDRPVRVNLDGRDAVELGSGDSVTITRGPRPIRFLSLGGHPFPQPVRHQFGLDHA